MKKHLIFEKLKVIQIWLGQNFYLLGQFLDFFCKISTPGWPKKIKPGRVVEDFVNLMDLAPTFCEAGQIKVPECMVAKSILPLLTSDIQHGQIEEDRNFVVMGRERHGK